MRRALFYDKRVSQEVEADVLGEEWAGYVLRITGGNDKEGFPMKQGVLTNTRVRLLLTNAVSCYRARRSGERKRKSVRGCIVGPDLAVLNLSLVRKGAQEIPGLTDEASAQPRRLGPKRATRLRKLFNLSKDDDVRKFVIRREYTSKNGVKYSKAPKIQRLITPLRLQRKRREKAVAKEAVERTKAAAAEYARLVAQRAKERRESRRSSRKSSRKVAATA